MKNQTAIETFLGKQQVMLIWIGIIIVLLLIVLVMLSWMTMLKVSLVERQTTGRPIQTDTDAEPTSEKAAAFADLNQRGKVTGPEEKATIFKNRLPATTATDEAKAAAFSQLQNAQN